MEERHAGRPAPDLADDGVPATEEVRDEVLRTGDAGVGDVPAPDRPWGAGEWGTTDLEQQAGEPMDGRLRREIPDREPGAAGGGRFSEPGMEDSSFDDEPDAVGELDPSQADLLSPEEAAMSIRDHAPGGTDDPDPGYLDGT